MRFRIFCVTLPPNSKLKAFSCNIWVVKRLLLIGFAVVVSLVSISCKGPGKEAPKNSTTEKVLSDTVKSDSLLSEMALAIEREVVLERVRSIYSLIRQESTYLGGSVDNDWLDKSFCSKRWNDLLMAVRRKEFLTNSLFFEVNRWTMTYDSNMISFDEFEVADCVIGPNNEKTAAVNFTVYSSDTYTPVRLELVYEDGQWKDWTDALAEVEQESTGEGFSVKEAVAVDNFSIKAYVLRDAA